MTDRRLQHRPLILVGPLPRPYSGTSVMFEFLRDELVARGIPHRIVDYGDRRKWDFIPRVFLRMVDWTILGLRYLLIATRRPTTVYHVIAQSRFGLLRDALIICYAALLRHKIVLHVNCGDYGGFWRAQPRWLQYAIRRLLRLADIIIVPSERLIAMFDFEPLLRSKIEIITNAAPLSEPPLTDKTPPNGEVRIVFLSNFNALKGYAEVIQTVGILRREHNLGATCRLVGSFFAATERTTAQARRNMQQMIQQEFLDDHVKILPAADHERKYELLRDSHFLVLPTRWTTEAQPVSIIEALAAGCVPIAPEYRAIPDMIVDGETGVLAGPDPSNIAKAIADLCSDPERYKRMSSAAVAHHRDLFTTDAHLQKMLNLLVPATASQQSVP